MEVEDKRKQISKFVTLVFLFLLPFCGTTFFYSRITTLVVVVWIGLILVNTLLFFKESRKNIKYLFIYYGLCLFYLGISYWRSRNFFSLIPNEYGLIDEGLTIIKLMMPVTFCYALYYQKLSKKEYFFIVKSWILLIAGSIVITNLLKVSYGSYSVDFIKYNIFEWRKGLYYADM